jgi:hypothetical protein
MERYPGELMGKACHADWFARGIDDLISRTGNCRIKRHYFGLFGE